MSLTVQVSGTDLSVSQTGTTAVTVSSTGIVGATGAIGAQGAAGNTGAQGAQGVAGNNGTNGAQGAQGAASNVAGPQGAQGSAGNNGAQGSPGTNGAQGAQGSAGNNGAQGAQGAPGTSGTSTFPYSGSAVITGSLEIFNTVSGYPITTTGDAGIKLIRSSSAFGFAGSVWGGYLSPLSATAIYNQTGGQLGGTKNPLALYPLSTAQDVALITVNYGANLLISASNEIYLGYGSSNTAAKTFIRDTAIINGSLTVSGSASSTGGFTGSLVGTSSFAITASFVPGVALLNSANIFTQSTVLSGSIRGEVNVLSISSNTASLDCSLDNFYTLQLVQATNTFINPSNIRPGQTINLRVNTTGSATVSFPTTVKQVSGSAYVPTTTTGVDVVTFISFDSSSLLLSNVKNLI